MIKKHWHTDSPDEILRRWNRFKNLRNSINGKEHILVKKDSDWLSVLDRESLVEVLIKRLKDGRAS